MIQEPLEQTEWHKSKGKSIEDNEDKAPISNKNEEPTMAPSQDQTITSLSCDENSDRVDTVVSSVPNSKTSSRLKERKVYN